MTLFDPRLPTWLDDEVLTRLAFARAVDSASRAVIEARRDLSVHRIVALLLAGDTGGNAAMAKLLRTSVPRKLATADPQRDLRNSMALGARVVIPGDTEWPTPVDDLQERAPACLWFQGPARPDWGRSVAVVGSRAGTHYGARVAGELAVGAASAGVAVVSGGAYGVDQVVHRAALSVEGGVTVAVLAGGLDRLYPKANEDLLRHIGRQCLLVSETVPGSPPARHRFLERNRLIAALTCATVVVEAAYRSGALNTANHAQDLGRPLGAVPGPVTSAMSAGCHQLLRESYATCVTDADQLLELAGLRTAAARSWEDTDVHDPVDLRLYDALAPGRQRSPVGLAEEVGLELRQVLAGLGRLELTGHAEAEAGLWRRRGTGVAEAG